MADCLFAKNATRCYQILSFILIFIVVILLAVVIHLGISNCKSDDDSPDSMSKEFILERYASFFRTLEEEAEFEREFNKRRFSLEEPICNEDDLVKSFTQLTKNQSNVETVRHHACCDSEVVWIDPDHAIDVDGQNVTIVQYDGRRQYFQSETCCQKDGCEIACACQQEPNTPKALVKNPSGKRPGVVVRVILVPGCCKCLNT